MKKYIVKIPLDYVMGYLRQGHLECEIDAESKEDALEKVKNEKYLDLNCDFVVDDYRVEDYGDKRWEDAEIKEVE